MLSGIIGKILASSLIFGTIGGGGYGILTALSHSNEDKKVEIKNINLSESSPEVVEEMKSDEKELDRSRENIKDEVPKVLEESKETKDSLEVQIPLAHNSLEMRQEKLIEISDTNKEDLLLWSIWNKKEGDNKEEKSYCFFLTSSDKNKEIPEFSKLSESNENCKKLSESSWKISKKLNDGWEEAFWTEGQKDKVKEIVEKNVSGILSSAGFIKNKDYKNDSISEYLKGVLSESCGFEERGEAIGITCNRKAATELSEEEEKEIDGRDIVFENLPNF